MRISRRSYDPRLDLSRGQTAGLEISKRGSGKGRRGGREALGRGREARREGEQWPCQPGHPPRGPHNLRDFLHANETLSSILLWGEGSPVDGGEYWFHGLLLPCSKGHARSFLPPAWCNGALSYLTLNNCKVLCRIQLTQNMAHHYKRQICISLFLSKSARTSGNFVSWHDFIYSEIDSIELDTVWMLFERYLCAVSSKTVNVFRTTMSVRLHLAGDVWQHGRCRPVVIHDCMAPRQVIIM